MDNGFNDWKTHIVEKSQIIHDVQEDVNRLGKICFIKKDSQNIHEQNFFVK